MAHSAGLSGYTEKSHCHSHDTPHDTPHDTTKDNTMNFSQALDAYPLMLTECAISERLRRRNDIQLHPTLFNTPLIYNGSGRKHLRDIYLGYRKIALKAGLPILLCAPTWRIDKQRVSESDFQPSILDDAINFMHSVGQEQRDEKSPVFIGGLIGPKNDCYTPEEALGRAEAKDYHAWQIDKMVSNENIDVIVCQTLPSVTEALGMADALAATSVDYIISFVIDRFSHVLDSTPINEAINTIDEKVKRPPVGYMVNCVYPTFLHAEERSAEFFSRMIGIQANSSSKDHHQLDGSDTLLQDSLTDWGAHMIELNSRYGVKILGGCCGTDDTYLSYLTEN